MDGQVSTQTKFFSHFERMQEVQLFAVCEQVKQDKEQSKQTCPLGYVSLIKSYLINKFYHLGIQHSKCYYINNRHHIHHKQFKKLNILNNH